MSNHSHVPEVIIPNLKKRFSGITSTILQVLPRQVPELNVQILGHPLDVSADKISLLQLFRLSRKNHPKGYPIIFHARRNDDMILGYILKKIFRRKLHLIFTSVAQREHSWITRFLYHRMDTLLTTSDRSASYLLRKPDATIPHGTDIERYHPSENRSKEWNDSGLSGKYGIGIFGRVRENKGVGDFVHALCDVLPNFPEFTAVICGETLPKDQDFVNELKSCIERKGLNDRFVWLGKRPFSELPTWFRRMSLVTAISHTEGFGLTCLEAMASAAPVIGTQTGGFEMIIRDGVDGYIIPCKDTDKLKGRLNYMLSNPKKLEEMGVEARKRIESDFTVEREANQLTQIYKNIQSKYISS